MDLDRRITFAYTMNRLGAGILGSERTHDYLAKVYEAFGASASRAARQTGLST